MKERDAQIMAIMTAHDGPISTIDLLLGLDPTLEPGTTEYYNRRQRMWRELRSLEKYKIVRRLETTPGVSTHWEWLGIE